MVNNPHGDQRDDCPDIKTEESDHIEVALFRPP